MAARATTSAELTFTHASVGGSLAAESAAPFVDG
jgi:hypothetical protein